MAGNFPGARFRLLLARVPCSFLFNVQKGGWWGGCRWGWESLINCVTVTSFHITSAVLWLHVDGLMAVKIKMSCALWKPWRQSQEGVIVIFRLYIYVNDMLNVFSTFFICCFCCTIIVCLCLCSTRAFHGSSCFFVCFFCFKLQGLPSCTKDSPTYTCIFTVITIVYWRLRFRLCLVGVAEFLLVFAVCQCSCWVNI